MAIDATGSVLSQGLTGMERSSQEITKAAETIANASVTSPQALNVQDSLVEPVTNMRVETVVFEASAKVVKTADEMLGTLINTKA